MKLFILGIVSGVEVLGAQDSQRKAIQKKEKSIFLVILAKRVLVFLINPNSSGVLTFKKRLSRRSKCKNSSSSTMFTLYHRINVDDLKGVCVPWFLWSGPNSFLNRTHVKAVAPSSVFGNDHIVVLYLLDKITDKRTFQERHVTSCTKGMLERGMNKSLCIILLMRLGLE